MPDVISDSKTFEDVLEKIDQEGCPLKTPEANHEGSFGNLRLTVLGPVNEYSDLNDSSLVLRADYGTTSFLFTGDAEEGAEEDMLAFHSPQAFAADVLKVGHHGSSTSTSPAWLDAVSPSFAIISCGEDNTYGHPHAETLTALSEHGISVLRTDILGSIILISDGQTVTTNAVA